MTHLLALAALAVLILVFAALVLGGRCDDRSPAPLRTQRERWSA